MKIFNTADLNEQSLARFSPDEASWIYNGLDCCVTAEIYNELASQLESEPPEVRDTYAFCLRKQAPIFETSLRGTLIDKRALQNTLDEFRRNLAELNSRFQRIMVGVFGHELNWRSPVQLKTLFYGELGLKEVKKRNANGLYVATVNREALESFRFYLHAAPLANFILAMRDVGKAISFLESELDPDGRIRTTYNLAGTNTGRLSSSMNDFGSGCVLPTAEALTPKGWLPVSELCSGDLIAQWDGGTIAFVPCVMHQEQTEKMVRFKTEQMQLTVTPGHRVPYSTYANPKIRVDHAGNIAFKGRKLLPLSGRALGGTYEVPAYLAMLLADFTLEGNIWRGAFKRQRKIDRLLSFGLVLEEQKARPDYRRFALKNHQHLPTKWGPWVLDLTSNSAEELVKEAAYWDSHKRGDSFIFYSADKEQADWFQALCHLTNRATTMRSVVNSDEAYGNNSVIWAVNVKPRTTAQVDYQHWSIEDYRGPVYCPSVPSSFWLVREEGYVCVTGNTNLQNVNRKLRFPFVPDPEMYLVNIDLEQADSRGVGARCWKLFHESHGPEFAGAYLDACESGDLHTFVCRMAWSDLDWPEDMALWRPIADRNAYRDKSYRDLAKALGHGTNYYGTPPTMAKHTHTEASLIKTFQLRYFRAFPCIPAWQEWVINEIKTHGVLYNLFGRRRMFFGRGNDASTHRKAIAYDPQSTTGEFIDRGWVQVYETFSRSEVQFLGQVHDSLLFQVPFDGHAELIPQILDAMQVHLDIGGGRSFTIPLEAKTGWNWGDFDKRNPGLNPYGLRGWKGLPEDRPRPFYKGKPKSFREKHLRG